MWIYISTRILWSKTIFSYLGIYFLSEWARLCPSSGKVIIKSIDIIDHTCVT